MTVWYAQYDSTTIDTEELWCSDPSGVGDYFDIANIDSDTVLCANGKEGIEINRNITCARISTAAEGGTAGGSFVASIDGGVINADILAGSSICIDCTSPNLTITGNLSSSTTTPDAYALRVSDLCTLTINGNLTAYKAHCSVINTYYAGSLITINGNVYGSPTTGYASVSGIFIGEEVGNFTLIINGNVTGGTSKSYGIYSMSISAINITVNGNTIGGTAIESYGVFTGSLAVVILNGDVIGGSYFSAYGVCHTGGVAAKIKGNIISSASCFGAAYGKIVRDSSLPKSSYFQLYNELGDTVKLFEVSANPFRRSKRRFI